MKTLLALLLAVTTCLASASTVTTKRDVNRVYGPNDGLDPVITMEQIGHAGNSLQSYRLQIFQDGRVLYHGLWRVKQLGEWTSYIKRDQIKNIQDEFAKYKFWRMPEYLPGHNGYGWIFTLREGSIIKTVRISGRAPVVLWIRAIEREVNSSVQRCPYMLGDTEMCASSERQIDANIETFLKRDLLEFMETYK